MKLARVESGQTAAVYAVHRPDWQTIGRAVAQRVTVVLALAAAGTVAICEAHGISPW